MRPPCARLVSAKIVMSSAKIAYVSTMAAMVMALPFWSGLRATSITPATAARPWATAEKYPTTATGRHAAK